MRVTVWSVLFAVIWSSVLLFILFFCRKKMPIRNDFQLHVLGLAYFLCFFRLSVPIDFPFTKGIEVSGLFSDILYFFSVKRWMLLFWKLSIQDVIICLISLIIIFRMISYLFNYYKVTRFIVSCNLYPVDQIQRVNGNVLKPLGKIPKVTVLKSNKISIPVVTGILKKKIILPDILYSDQELFYIFLHEYLHIGGHDLEKKLLIDLWECFFWWIPFISFFKKDMVQSLEAKCDGRTANLLDDEQLIEYMDVLVQSIKRASDIRIENSNRCVLQFAINEEPHAMIERFRIIANGRLSQKRIRKFPVLCVMFFAFLLSYTVVLLPSYEADISEIEEDGGKMIIPANAYLIHEDYGYILISEENEAIALSDEYALMMLEDGFEVKENMTDNEE